MLRHVYSLVLDNISRCGDLQTVETKRELEDLNGKKNWKLTISNKVSKKELHGEGQGLERAEQYSDKYGITIEHRSDPAVWYTTITVPNCFQLDQTLG